MRSIRFMLAALAVLVLGACYPPTTSHPIGTTVGLKRDPSLMGLWKAQPDPGQQRFYYYDLLSTKDGAIFAILVPDQGEASDVMMFKLTTARVGDFGFMNVRVMKDSEHETPDQPKGSVPVLYRFDAKGRLVIFLLDGEATDSAILAHKIAGMVGKEVTDDQVITADGAALDKFFRSRAGQALFRKPFAILTRVK